MAIDKKLAVTIKYVLKSLKRRNRRPFLFLLLWALNRVRRDNRVQMETLPHQSEFPIIIGEHLAFILGCVYIVHLHQAHTCTGKNPEQASGESIYCFFTVNEWWKQNCSHKIYTTFRRFWGKKYNTLSCFSLLVKKTKKRRQ